MEKIQIIGAGLCGTMLAVRMAQKGYQVDLYEKRGDLRKEEIPAGRSINLALSDRGFKALSMIGIAEKLEEICIPMLGRMIHHVDGSTQLFSYSGRQGEYINSVSRSGLNAVLLDEAERHPNINMHFHTDCVSVDLHKKSATFQHPDGTFTIGTDVFFGTDGAGSALRKAMLGHTTEILFSYSQDFLKHGYKEMAIMANADGSHKIDKNALHIWPRGSFMIIALPNMDGSFTVTMFYPVYGPQSFAALDTKAKVEQFFKEFFPDLVDLIPNIADEFFVNPVGTLGTIKCSPWQYNGQSLLMGDAAHAIVPFYGQGMNASFEDVVVLDQVIDSIKNGHNWETVFEQYEATRKKDTDAIADLAIDNFYEMRDAVANPVFQRKRSLEMALESQYVDYFSKYSLVTFREDVPYSEAMRRGRLQDAALLELCADTVPTDLDAVMQTIRAIK